MQQRSKTKIIYSSEQKSLFLRTPHPAEILSVDSFLVRMRFCGFAVGSGQDYHNTARRVPFRCQVIQRVQLLLLLLLYMAGSLSLSSEAGERCAVLEAKSRKRAGLGSGGYAGYAGGHVLAGAISRGKAPVTTKSAELDGVISIIGLEREHEGVCAMSASAGVPGEASTPSLSSQLAAQTPRECSSCQAKGAPLQVR